MLLRGTLRALSLRQAAQNKPSLTLSRADTVQAGGKYSNKSFLGKKFQEGAPKHGWYVRSVPYLINNFRRSRDYLQPRHNPWPQGFSHHVCVHVCVCVRAGVHEQVRWCECIYTRWTHCVRACYRCAAVSCCCCSEREGETDKSEYTQSSDAQQWGVQRADRLIAPGATAAKSSKPNTFSCSLSCLTFPSCLLHTCAHIHMHAHTYKQTHTLLI